VCFLQLLPTPQALHDETAQVDEDLLEADAKNRLYQLLGERTRQEHMALDQKVGLQCHWAGRPVGLVAVDSMRSAAMQCSTKLV
jgi:hypothetical protein